MAPIRLQGKLVSADIWLSEPEIDTAVFVSAIQVPEVLQTRAFYEAEISISTEDETIEFVTDVGIEPAQTNAIGQKRERVIAFAMSRFMSARALDGAAIRLAIKPEPKLASQEFARFREAMGRRSKTSSD
jgi:hypothetical protein